MNNQSILKINRRSFFLVCSILVGLLILAYIATLFITKGEYIAGVYTPITGRGYSFWSFLLTPLRLFASSDALTVIVVSLFITILSGAFNIINQTDGIRNLINSLINRFSNHRYLLMYMVILFFMLFGSLFGIFEESVTLLPIIVLLAISLGWDTFTGLGMCLLAAGMGFSSAITNPFSIGLGSKEMELAITTGIGFRIVFFIVMYLVLCIYMTLHVKKIEKDPLKSPSYDIDQEKRTQLNLSTNQEVDHHIVRVYGIFFLVVLGIIILSSVLPFVQNNGLSIPIIMLTFLFGSFISGLVLKKPFKEICRYFGKGFIDMLPAVIMIVLAGSIKLVLVDAKVMDTIIKYLTDLLVGIGAVQGVFAIYLVILIIQFFIGSASAKVILIVPIIKMLADNLGMSRNLALLSFVFGDGYTDLIYITNPVLLIALGMVSFSYLKWFKKTFVLQLIILVLTVIALLMGYYIGY